jgi:hypothetical protein
MFGRIDDVKFQTGAAKMRNFIATPQGPAENRPGTMFVREVKYSNKKTRLISFTYSTTQTMVIEIGEGYFRFHTNGGTVLLAGVPYEVVNPYLEADLFDIHYVQSADVLTLVHPNYPPAELRRLGATNWTYTVISFTPTVTQPAGVAVVASPGYKSQILTWDAVTGLITTVNNHTLSEGDGIYISGVSGPTNTPDGFYVVEDVPIDPVTQLPIKDQMYVTDYDGTLIIPNAGASGGTIQFGTKRFDIDNYYQVTALATNGLDESDPSLAVNVVNNLYVSGSYNTISWSAVAGAARYNVYKRQSGLYGYIGKTEGLNFVDDNIAPDMGVTPPIRETTFASAGNYPGSVSYFEQRRAFAGTINEPQTLWMTRSGTESDMSFSLPVKDTDRVKIRVAAREANTVRHIVPLTQLLMLTSSAEWRVSPINSDAITPTTVSVRPQSYIGANNVQPSLINNSLVYCAARGGHVRELGYSWQANGFITGDLSLRAAHLFDSLDILDMAYSKAPQPLLWFISSSGNLLGLTYVPEQQIGAWHWHDTDGTFESCAVVAEGNEDVLYVVVRRTIGGATKRYVERMMSRQITTLDQCFFVDCGLTYTGAPTNTVTGLGHLNGKTVSILADGAVMPQKVVAGGQITIEQPASVITVGLPYESDLQTLPLSLNIDGFGQGRFKNINKAWLRVFQSSGIFIGPDANNLTEAKQRTNEPYGSPPSLKSAEILVMLTPSWQADGQVYIRQQDPLPLTIVGLTLEAVIGG